MTETTKFTVTSEMADAFYSKAEVTSRGTILNLEAAIEAALAAAPEQHPDDIAVDRFAAAMKKKLARKRAEGFGGWDDHEKCSVEYLEQLLVEQIRERSVIDPVDISNFAMMIHQRGETPSRGR